MYFKVQYTTGGTDILNLRDDTQVGKTYKMYNGQVFKVLGKKTFKYTMDDLDNLRVILEGYDEGEYYDIYKRVMKALDKGVPSIRFSSYEKELLGMQLEHEDLPYLRQTLIKVIGE